MNELVEVLEVVALVLVVLYLATHAKGGKRAGCGCAGKAVDEPVVGKGPCA